MWQPTASLDALKKRAEIIHQIRQFFFERGVLEVETPLLSHATVTDPYILSLSVSSDAFLQTSPEYAMKRLLAAGAGSIYQICKAFRQDPEGKIHNPEFTILEWYRPGFDHHDLMNEMDELLQVILKTSASERISYAALFEKFLNINPHLLSDEELAACVQQKISLAEPITDRGTCLDLLLTHCIEPHIGQDRPVFLYDFPPIKAALAKIRHEENPPVASRFEVYFKGMELANGFHELQDAKEQRMRFEKDLAYREKNNILNVPLDERFLAALESGLPDCSGVALGVDRLVMLALGVKTIREALSFTWENA